ncbi:MAG: type I restriction-modification system subunit M [Bacteroidota bacterium]
MAIKKSELYSSLWESCDALRGGMDASQYKDYVLVMLFVKYISDKYAGQPYSPITIPAGASFQDMVNLKGKTDIGDQINKKILAPIAQANNLAKFPDFNDPTKLGNDKEMVDTLTDLISIFENPALDFSKNKADGDDILGDAYEYLMRHFATQSGKSKGQFYTPAEVSRTMAKIIGINEIDTHADITVYDPTCGSGSLLLKVGEEANSKVTLYGQEKDSTTAGLARMNMILHDNPTAEIKQGNTLANPLFEDKEGKGNLKTFDFVVANPPFSDKRWSQGLTLPNDTYDRFADYGIPPAKNGDYAFLLHIIRSLKRNGKGAIILPHGVLFRGNAEAEIRTNLIKKGYIRGIIGLPANLFYGTGIPAAIIFVDKENAHNRKGIFMIDAGKGYIKDGNKNRLREQDIRRITDVFAAQKEIPGYSKMVSITEIADHEYNLNISRYIDNQEQEDLQDIQAHLQGGIPVRDIDELDAFWEVFPTLRKSLFERRNDQYADLTIAREEIKEEIYSHPEFKAFLFEMEALFQSWSREQTEKLKALDKGHQPKAVIAELAEDLLRSYHGKALVNKYNIYQILLSYWNESMQDDCYLISADGWVAETYRIIEKAKNGKEKDKGWTCDLVPKSLVITQYFQDEQAAIDQLQQDKENLSSQIAELEEAHSGEEGAFAELEKVNKANASKRLKLVKTQYTASPDDDELKAEMDILEQYIKRHTEVAKTNKAIKSAETELDEKLYTKYPTLTPEEVKTLVVEEKWMATLQTSIQGEINHISQRLTNRIAALAERYETPLPSIDQEVKDLEDKVNAHLAKMGFPV